MSLTIEVELKDVLNGINQKLDVIQKDVTDLKLGQAEIKGDIKAVDERLSGKINTLETKVDGLTARVGSQEFLSRTIVGGLVLIILGGAARMFWSFPVNP
ncbi:hypothetical protein [Chamaesiphon polymorphus]|uniref:DUF4164 domain-containing protein n=1 Tax=Chamaesiphon polymorphus CCALA 037 TaxID=2107692 RepID=A0A2T1GJJ8_9CYAN|nr:hypothetical protein [Chamaesiphon polymorphus]PSB57982.1 hypothetical protein C7B77_06335 [Chamaesiphon polymorphus CCALA 037]